MSTFSEDLRQLIAEHLGQPAMVGSYTLLAELFFEEGDQHLFSAHSDDMPYWRELGMLECRKQDISLGYDVIVEDE